MFDHSDVYKEIDNDAGQNQAVDQEFEQFNEPATEKVEISHPETSRKKIQCELPLLVRMASKNREEFDEERLEDRSVDELFDETICRFAAQAMSDAGLPVDEYMTHRLRALLLKQARGIPSYKELADYLDSYEEDRLADFGLERKYSQSWYRKGAKKLKNAEEHELLEEAAFIGVHACWWNGKPIPDDVKSDYGIDLEVDAKGSNFDVARDVAFYSILSDLLDIVNKRLTLNRNSNSDRDIETVLGAFAAAADSDKSVRNYHKAARHTFDLSDALAGSTITTHIGKLSVSDVQDMFESIYYDLFEYVISSGVASEPLVASYDLVDLDTLVDDGAESSYLTKDGRMWFACLALTDPDLEFAFGLEVLESKSERTDVLQRFLRELTSTVEVGRLFVDRGFNGAEDILVMEEQVPQKWFLHAKKDDNIRGIVSDVRKVERAVEPGENDVVRSAAFKDVSTPLWMYVYTGEDDNDDSGEASESVEENATTGLSEFTELNESSGSIESLKPYRLLYSTSDPSDIIKDEDKDLEEFIKNLNFHYEDRGKIENVFRQAKNGFDVSTDSSKDVAQLFYFNMSVLFYNLYKIVNTVPAPNNGLELDVREDELLEVIQLLSFGGVSPLGAYSHFENTNE